MDDSTAEKLKTFFKENINRHSGNIILMVGSSECGKSTMLAKVLLPTFSFTEGFITTFMSQNYDSLPIQQLIIESLAVSAEKKAKLGKEVDALQKGDSNAKVNFKIDDLYKVKEWIMTKRGFDKSFCEKVYAMRLLLNKHYGDSGQVREFRYVLALDDEIDIGGALIRKVCLTWRNRNISWVQLVQDITNLDTAVRNSAPLVFFGYMNFPHRREQIVRGYLEPYLPGKDVKEKMNSYLRYTENKCFIFMNHRIRKAFHLNTHTGEIQEMPEITTVMDQGVAPVKEKETQCLTKEGTKTPFRENRDALFNDVEDE